MILQIAAFYVDRISIDMLEPGEHDLQIAKIACCYTCTFTRRNQYKLIKEAYCLIFMTSLLTAKL